MAGNDKSGRISIYKYIYIFSKAHSQRCFKHKIDIQRKNTSVKRFGLPSSVMTVQTYMSTQGSHFLCLPVYSALLHALSALVKCTNRKQLYICLYLSYYCLLLIKACIESIPNCIVNCLPGEPEKSCHF